MTFTQVTPLRPRSEQVAVAWLASIPGFSTAMVAEQLPPDANPDGSPAPWISTGFITVAVVGGTRDPDIHKRSPVIQADTWAAVPGSNMPPWPVAANLADHISAACHDRQALHRALAISQSDVVYPGAYVLGAYVMTEPRRMYDDVGDYARYSMDLQLHWLQAGETNP